MNYKDVALLNSSLDQLGESLLKQRMLDQKEKDDQELRANRASQLDIERGRVDVDKSRANATQTHYDNLEKQAGLKQAFEQMVQSGKDLKDGMSFLGDQVRNGGMTPDQATDYFKNSVDVMPGPVKEKFLNHPTFKPAYSGDLDWAQVGAPKPFRPANDPPAVATEKAAHALDVEAAQMQEEDPEGAKEKQMRAELLRGTIRKTPPKPAQPPAAVATIEAIQKMKTDANRIRATDPEGAKQLDTGVELLEGHLRKTPPPVPTVRTSVTRKDKAGNSTTFSGRADLVDEKLKTTGKTLDQVTAAQIFKEAGGDKDKARQLAIKRGYAL